MANIKSFEQFISEEDFFKGGLANGMTAQELADKHGLSVEEIEAALEKGQKVEIEHTNDEKKAYEIAKDHIFEDPKYYEKLAKIEDDGVTTEAVTIHNDRYVRAHGKSPKGKGMWAFSYDNKGNDPIFTPSAMSFADASKWIKDKAKEDKKDIVFVLENINKYSPLSYAERVANKTMTIQDAAKETKMPITELIKLVRRFDKNFKIQFEGTFSDGEIAIYDDPSGDDGETRIYKRNKGYYGQNDSFDFEAADKKELEKKLKSWGYKLIAGSIDESELTEQDHEVGMAQGQLDAIIKAATELKAKMGEVEINLPGWIQDHISQTYNYIKQANDNYHQLKEGFTVEAEEPFANFALSLFAIRDQAHMFHWQTTSIAQHEALGEFYEDFIEKTDDLIENIMGKMGRPSLAQGTITVSGYSDTELAQFIKDATNVLSIQLPQFVEAEGNEEIFNIAQELQSLINKLSYLITLE